MAGTEVSAPPPVRGCAAQFLVQMPDGMEPGQTLTRTAPDGQVLQFPAPDFAPGESFLVSYNASSTGAAPNASPIAPPIDRREMLILRGILDRFEIRLAQAVDLNVLRNYEIVIIADDSGSMGLRDMGAKVNRWEELKETLSLIIEIGGCFNACGLDINFLNRPKVSNVMSPSDSHFVSAFASVPRGGTPLTRKLNTVVAESSGGKPVLLVILTDGVPDDGPTNFGNALRNVVGRRTTSTEFRVQIMACTRDDQAVGWINRLHGELKEIGVTDDYDSERAKVLLSGRMREFSRGDWVMKAMLGPISSKFDDMDEQQRDSSNCANCIKSCVMQ